MPPSRDGPAGGRPPRRGRRRHPAHGHQRSEWDADCRFDFENPDDR